MDPNHGGTTMNPRRLGLSALVLGVTCFVGGRVLGRQEGPPMPKPTAHHEGLKKAVGVWDATVKMMGHDGKPSESKATETTRMLGEFWSVSEFKGEMMGMPYQGISLRGYDADKKKHVSAWVDSMSPQLSLSEGECSDDCRKVVLYSSGKDMTGQPVRWKMVSEAKGEDEVVFTMSPEGKGGEEMVITYTRKK
jgi:hypothetical protein